MNHAASFLAYVISVLFALVHVVDGAAAQTPPHVDCVSNLVTVTFRRPTPGVQFSFEARVTFPPKPPENCLFAVEDDTGAILLRGRPFWTNGVLRAGDRIRLDGVTVTALSPPGVSRLMSPNCYNFEVIARETPPVPMDVDAATMRDGKHDFRFIRLEAVLRDSFRDEIDPQFRYLVLNCGGETVYAMLPWRDSEQSAFEAMIGLRVLIDGVCVPAFQSAGHRQMIGYHVKIDGIGNLRLVQSPPDDPFNVPRIGDIALSIPEFARQGRLRAVGRVIAVWNSNNLLLKTKESKIVRVEIADGVLPRYGDAVEALGFPETDLYRINLMRTRWRPAQDPYDAETDLRQDAVDVTAAELMVDRDRHTRFATKFHGQAIRLRGIVRSLPPAKNGNGRFYLADGDILVPVDVSSCVKALDGVEVDCTISVTGTCVMESGNWHPNSEFPHIEGFFVVVRKPDDIRILSRPPWWTPGRLVAVIGTLLAALFGIFVWNRMLNRRAEQRGKELAAEQVAHVTSDLKVYERTRLAVELHDSLSQNLTGVSLAIRAANRLADTDPDGMRRSLGLAAKSLDSCRDELRNCLWDLRNQTLEESSMDEAIRLTLAPHIGNAKLAIRFNVPRDRLSDNTTHAILRIIRELVTNAVRHGGATEIKVAGAIEDNRLMFSVADNGCGFDPECCPSTKDGHFGLQGIQDRVDALEGDFTLASTTGNGTKATISIKLKSSQMSPMSHSSQKSQS